MRDVNLKSFVMFLALLSGVALPPLLVTFGFGMSTEAYKERLDHYVLGIFMTSVGVYLYVGFKLISRIRPSLERWLEENYYPQVGLAFIGTFVLSLLSISLSLIPLPYLLHLGFAVLFGFSALYVLFEYGLGE